MFDEKEFIEKLVRYEIKSKVSSESNEIKSIIHYFENEEDAMYGAIYYGFILGCMKTEEYIVNLLTNNV